MKCDTTSQRSYSQLQNMDSSSSSEYSRWGCVYFQPPEHTQLRYEISRGQLADKISRGEFRDLPVDVGHASEVATVGRITDAVQAKTNGSVFVRVAVKPGTLESDFAISMMRNGQMRGLSLQHDSGTDERKLLAVGVTPKPRRPNTFLLPEGTDPSSSSSFAKKRNGSTIVSFSAFDSLDIYGTLDASSSSQNPNVPEADEMSSTQPAPAATASTQPPADAKPVANPQATNPATAKPTETKGVMLDGELATPEEIKALVEYTKKMKQDLEETKRAMQEKENMLKPVLEEQKNKALKLMQGLFAHGVAAVSEAETKEIEETQQYLMSVVEKDPKLLARIAKYSPTEQKATAPVRDRDALGRFVSSHHDDPNQAHDAQPPPQREDRRSSKRNRSADELISEYSSSSGAANEGLANKLLMREPESKSQPRQLHPVLRDILGASALEQQRAVAYSAASAEKAALYEQYERNRVEAIREMNTTTTLLPTTEFPNLRSYEDYLRSGNA